MVNKRTLFLLCAAWLLPLAAVSASLTVDLADRQVVYGQPLTVTLRAPATGTPTQPIDLEPLRRDFVVERVSDSDADDQDSGQVIRLALYPRRTGELRIPPLAQAGKHSEPETVQVTQASDAGRPLGVQTSLSPAAVWTRQQVLVQVEVRSVDRFFELQTPEFRDSHMAVVPLHTQVRTERVDGVDYVVKTTGWALYPGRSGNFTLDLPTVNYLRGGRIQARFALPHHALDVRPLPPYVPPDMPVGVLSLATRIDAPAVLDTETLAFWEVDVQGRGVPAAALPSPLAPVRDTHWLQFLPTQAQRRQHTGAHGILSTLSYRIPFAAKRSGPVSLPGLDLQYFDPNSGRIVRVATAPVRLWSMGTVWRMVLGGLVLIAGAYAAHRAVNTVRVQLARARRRRAALQEIASAASARGIRLALYRFGQAHGWRLDGSLHDWLAAFKRHYRRIDPNLEQIVDALNQREFSIHPGYEFAPLRTAVAAALRNARPKRRTPRAVYSAWRSNSSAISPAAPR